MRREEHLPVTYRLFIITILLLTGGCASLPPNISNPQSFALQDTGDTPLGRTYHELHQSTSGESGFVLLGNGVDALAARLALTRDAERSIDVQYYMFHNDMVGSLVVEELLKAADRGIRVRVLLDDIDLADREENLIVFASHQNIDLRVFNPFSRNSLRESQFFTRFGSVTRRMHNKSYTVDNQAAIIGGRNIGNEYFEADPDLAFVDLDVLTIGPVVNEVSTSFDSYWNSDLAYPIEMLHPELLGIDKLEDGRKRLAAYLLDEKVLDYKQVLHNSNFAENLRIDALQYRWGEAKVLYDHPQKIDSYDEEHVYTLSYQMNIFLASLHKELIIFSPYFVPGEKGTKNLSKLSKSGIRIRILTNSLSSTDVSVVHAGYAKYRSTLLRNGVELYELKKTLSSDLRKQKGYHQSTNTSLHAKSLVVDREMVFIGSLNLDPRSITENTEIGIMVMSKGIAGSMADIFDLLTEKMAYRLELRTDEEGIEHIYWHGLENDQEHVWTKDPHTGFWQRLGIFFMGLLPIESQL